MSCNNGSANMNWASHSAVHQALPVSVVEDEHLQGHSDPILGLVLQGRVGLNPSWDATFLWGLLDGLDDECRSGT